MQAEKFVLQCRSCRNIIGDSSSLVRKSNDYHTLSRTSNVQLTTHIGKSNPLSHLAEGTAQTFICNGCRSCLGAVYRATPPGFDYLRNNWTIDPNKIFKFTLGDTRLTLQKSDVDVCDLVNGVKGLAQDALMVEQMKLVMLEMVEKLELLEGLDLKRRIEEIEKKIASKTN